MEIIAKSKDTILLELPDGSSLKVTCGPEGNLDLKFGHDEYRFIESVQNRHDGYSGASFTKVQKKSNETVQ